MKLKLDYINYALQNKQNFCALTDISTSCYIHAPFLSFLCVLID